MGEEFIRRIMVLGEVPSLGPVLLFDDMEGLLKWVESDGVGDFVFEKDETEAYNGSACLHMKTRTAGAAAADIIIANRYFPQRPGKRYRFECLWNLAVNANCNLATFSFWVYDGVYQHHAKFHYDPQTLRWLYSDSGGMPAVLTGGSQNLAGGKWHRFMFEIDQNKAEYIKMISDGLELPMPGLEYYHELSDIAVLGLSYIQIKSQAAVPPEIWVDDVLVMEI